MISIDLQKVFEATDHKILLDKLVFLVFQIQPFHGSNHTCRSGLSLSVENDYSDPGDLTCDIPQGSILRISPLLYVNDMPSAIKNASYFYKLMILYFYKLIIMYFHSLVRGI